jgi:hypothetical protein
MMSLAPRSRAESSSVTSSPAGAKLEINGVLVGTAEPRTENHMGFMEVTAEIFAVESIIEWSLLRVSKDGYSTQQIALTNGPFEWVAVAGKHHGNYFWLKSDHFELELEPAGATSDETWPGDDRVGPIHPRNVAASLGAT